MSILDSGKHNREGPVHPAKIYSATEDVAKLEGYAGKGLLTAVEVVRSVAPLVEDEFAAHTVDRDFLDNVSLARKG